MSNDPVDAVTALAPAHDFETEFLRFRSSWVRSAATMKRTQERATAIMNGVAVEDVHNFFSGYQHGVHDFLHAVESREQAHVMVPAAVRASAGFHEGVWRGWCGCLKAYNDLRDRVARASLTKTTSPA